MAYVILAVLVLVVVLAIVRLRPRLRERRYEAWRQAGLMPDQIERDAPGDEPR